MREILSPPGTKIRLALVTDLLPTGACASDSVTPQTRVETKVMFTPVLKEKGRSNSRG
ncbi:MAG TPA: hypothetical protein VJ997_03290 [Longimicrobiales bacterium]|nr:hypothetical protein [Longimicrobiales bacterium]